MCDVPTSETIQEHSRIDTELQLLLPPMRSLLFGSRTISGSKRKATEISVSSEVSFWLTFCQGVLKADLRFKRDTITADH